MPGAVMRLVKQPRLALGLLDVLLVAGSGFLVNLFAGRFLSIENYGIFVVLYTLVSFAATFQTALITSPYVILSQSTEKHNNVRYFIGNLLFTLIIGLLASSVCTLLSIVFTEGMNLNSLVLIAYSAFVFLYLLQEFLRRHFYAFHQEQYAFVLDIVSFGGQLILIFLLRETLSMLSLLLALSSTSLLGILCIALLRYRKFSAVQLSSELLESLRHTFRVNWVFGRWVLLSGGVSWVATQLYILTVALFQTPTAVAQFGAVRTLAAISNPMVMAYESMGTPRAAKTFDQHGFPALNRYIGNSSVVGGLFFGALGIVFFLYPEAMIQLLFGKSFGDIRHMVMLASALPILWYLGKVFSIALLAIHRPKSLLPVYISACLITVSLGLWLAYAYGALGAVIGLLLNGIILTVGFGLQFYRYSQAGKDEYGSHCHNSCL